MKRRLRCGKSETHMLNIAGLFSSVETWTCLSGLTIAGVATSQLSEMKGGV